MYYGLNIAGFGKIKVHLTFVKGGDGVENMLEKKVASVQCPSLGPTTSALKLHQVSATPVQFEALTQKPNPCYK